jgi:hypothetical protein
MRDMAASAAILAYTTSDIKRKQTWAEHLCHSMDNGEQVKEVTQQYPSNKYLFKSFLLLTRSQT